MEVRLLHGGWSGAKVALVTPYDRDENVLERCVAKLDPSYEELLEEKKQTIKMRADLGENAPQVIRSARQSFAEHLIATKALRCTATDVRPGCSLSLSGSAIP